MTTARGRILWSIALIYLVKCLKSSFTPFDDVLYFMATSSEIFTQYSFYLEYVHGIFQARILECVALFFSRVSSQPRGQTSISCISRQIVYHCATWKEWPSLNTLIGKFRGIRRRRWRRQWHPTPVLLPGKFHGWRSLVGCSPWGCEESDTTEWLHFHFSLSCTGEGNGNPLQYSSLENPRDGGAWWAVVYGVAQSRTRLKWFSSSSSRDIRKLEKKKNASTESHYLAICRSFRAQFYRYKV